MAITWQKEEILFVYEDENFIVQLAEDEDLIFWELVDTRYVGPSDEEISAAHSRETHPVEQTLMVRGETGYTKVYRKVMRIEILGQWRQDLIKSLISAA